MKYAVIAAGEGSRLAQEGITVPKPLVSIDGRPMIQRLCEIFAACDAESVHVIVNSGMEDVSKFLLRMHLDVPLHVMEARTPSSLHSFEMMSRCWDDGKFVLTTVDTVFRPDEFAAYVGRFEAMPPGSGLMAVTDYIDDEKPLYVETDGSRITGFRDEPYPGCRFVSGGIYGLDGGALRVLRDCVRQGVSRMRNYQRALVRAGVPLAASPMSKIIDVDHAIDIATAQRLLSQPPPPEHTDLKITQNHDS